MKYLNLFKTEHEYLMDYQPSDFDIIYIEDIDKVIYKPKVKIKSGRIRLSIPNGVDPNTINVKIAPLKYNKRFVFGYSVDDSSMQSYSVAMRSIQGKYVDNTEFLHLGNTLKTTGIKPKYPLCFTDGCGNNKYFGHTVYLITHQNVSGNAILEGGIGLYNPSLTFNELKYLNDFDFDWCMHNVNEFVYDKTNIESVLSGLYEVNKYISGNGLPRTILGSYPDGNAIYPQSNELCNDIYSYINEKAYSSGIRAADITNFNTTEKFKIYRHFANDSTISVLQNAFSVVESRSILGQSVWQGSIGTHRPRGKTDFTSWNDIYGFLDWIYNTHGSGGLDDVWFPSDREMFEYMYMSKLTTIEKIVDGNDLLIDINMPEIKDFKYYDLTLICEGGATDVINTNNNVYGMSCSNKDNKLMVNVNLRNDLVSKAEKYTTIFENNIEDEELQDAIYMIRNLKPSLQKKYMDRINNICKKPIITDFVIPTSTDDNIISGEFIYSNLSMEYIISDISSDFEGAEWEHMIDNIGNITIKPIPGEHTLYCKLRNPLYESDVFEKKVTFIESTFELTSLILNNGNSNIYTSLCNVTFEIKGIESPSHYRISETLETLETSEWIEYVNNFDYDLINTGEHVLYAQIKLADGTLSSIKNSSINYVNKKAIIIGSTGWNDKNNGYHEDTGISICRFDSVGSNGKFNTGESFKVIASNMKSYNDAPANVNPYYPNEYLLQFKGWNNKLIDDVISMVNISNLPSGIEKYSFVKVYAQTSNVYTSTMDNETARLNSWYKCNNSLELNPPISPNLSDDCFIIFTDVVPIEGKITIETYGTLDFVMCPITAIELIP